MTVFNHRVNLVSDKEDEEDGQDDVGEQEVSDRPSAFGEY